MTEIGTVVDGKYEILKEIGRGGMSVVYLAMDKHLNKQWAVKEIRKQANGKNDEIIINSLLVEANLMKRLDHPALPRIVDIIDNGVTIYVVMDYIEGESLDKILKEYGAQPEDMVVNWAEQVCDALAYLHSQKPPIIYRDMKPANLMLKPEGNIKIIDFGIAREYKEQNLADTTVLGTKGYAPPEQYSGQTDARSDIYALGMTMHHLLTGVDPRTGEGYVPVRMYNSALSEGIELIIDKCVQPAAENRYQSCNELMYDLEHRDYITSDYKNRQKRKLTSFIAAAGMSVLLLAGGFICKGISNNMNNNEYDVLVASTNNNISKLQEAIDIYPERPEAYYRILDTYADSTFDIGDLTIYSDEVGKNKELLMKENKEDVAALNYQCGMMCINMLKAENSDDDADWRTRVLKAKPFFEENFNILKDVDYEQKTLNDCYYRICCFYKDYIFEQSAFMKSAGKKEYDELLETVTEAVHSIENAGDYDKISLYHSIMNLINNEAVHMSDAGVEKGKLLGIFDDIYSRAKNLDTIRKAAQDLKDEILLNADDFRDAIETAYKNEGTRKAIQEEGKE